MRRDSTNEPISPVPLATSTSNKSTARTLRPRRWLRVIGITVGVLLLLVVLTAGGVGVFAYQQFPALNNLGNQFCHDMLAQSYGDAYHLLSARLRARYSTDTFTHMGQTLDTFEGNVESCGSQSLNQVQPGLFPISLTMTSAMTRQKAGARQGPMRVVYEQGAWKVDSLSPSLLGIDPDALATAFAWCDDTAHYSYMGVWSLYGHALQGQDPSSAVTRLHAPLTPTGSVAQPLACTLTTLRVSGDQRRVSVTFEITDTQEAFNATLGQEHGHWRIITISPDALGQLIAASKTASPVTTVASNWLAALTRGDCPSAYAMLTSDAQQRISLSAFTSQVCFAWDWNAVRSDGIFTQSAARTTITIEFSGVLPGAEPGSLLGPIGDIRFSPRDEVVLIEENGSWKVDALQPL